jgi:hypothetical protein
MFPGSQGNRVNSQLLVVRSQIANLTLDPSFGRNWCFRCPNGSCEPILNIYVSIIFQWYRKLLNPLGFWTLQSLSEHSIVHWDSNSQGGSSLGSVRVHSLTFVFTPMLPLLARNLTSPYLGCELLHQNASQFTLCFITFWVNLDIFTIGNLVNPLVNRVQLLQTMNWSIST